MSLVPIVAGLALALPLGLACIRWRWLYQPTAAVFNVLYALPSLPLFQRVSAVVAAPGVQGLAPDALAPITWNIASWRRATP